ncbi:facilitated trehalose transporter Tret1-like isoform X1 [Zerene cesonia]|uniref:facilitated trehalose transporter Tret1-like isoform X1 n=1 Tax=Zerene cesonia TaxID=33412 RepID=UPI0018E59BE0|nr:facilitated trehalose transporter Tret1-like isoform X1 [Zerene cesonia]
MISHILNRRTSIEVNDTEMSWILYITTPGYIFGSLLTLFVCDRYGRRPTLLLSAVFYFIGMIFSAVANAAWMLCVSQFLWGIGTGIVLIVVTVYLAEIAEQDIRGRLCVVSSFMTDVGILFIVGVGALVSYRAFNYWLPLMPVLFFAACYSIPESPYYLIKKGNIDQARDALLRLRGDCPTAGSELERMISEVKEEMQNSTSFFDLFRRIIYVKAIVIVFGFKLLQHISGMISYQKFYFRILKESDLVISFNTLILIALGVQTVAAILATLLVDTLGRRRLLIFSFIGASMSLATAAPYFYLRSAVPAEQFLKSCANVPLIAVLLFIFMSFAGLNSVIRLLEVEMFPINVRIMGIVAVHVFGSIGLPINKLYYTVEDAIGVAGVMGIYALIALIGAVFTYFLLPETKGKSLSEIQHALQGKRGKNVQEMTNIEGNLHRF